MMRVNIEEASCLHKLIRGHKEFSADFPVSKKKHVEVGSAFHKRNLSSSGRQIDCKSRVNGTKDFLRSLVAYRGSLFASY